MIGFRLAAAAAFSLTFGAPAAAQPARQTIIVWSFGFAPKPIQLAAGRRVTLTFENRSGNSHDFVARSFFANSQIISGDVMNGMVDLRSRETKSVTLIPRRGTYKAHCSHFLHSPLGMTDTIIVN
jgi:plastocyanin